MEEVEVGNSDGYQEQEIAIEPKRGVISIAQLPLESKTTPFQNRSSIPIKLHSPSNKVVEPLTGQMILSDFGLYNCEVCGKMAMGFEKENHEREIHGGKSVEWKKMR